MFILLERTLKKLKRTVISSLNYICRKEVMRFFFSLPDKSEIKEI